VTGFASKLRILPPKSVGSGIDCALHAIEVAILRDELENKQLEDELPYGYRGSCIDDIIRLQ